MKLDLKIIWGVVDRSFVIKWGVGWGYLRRSLGRCTLILRLNRLKRGF